METYSYSSYPDSVNSSPRSRDVDVETSSVDESYHLSSTNYRVKFMCSYGGTILPRPHDNQLSYVGGDTKILSVDRNIRFPALLQKLNSFSDSDMCFKYQLPGEDLDALISVTNDDDLEHLMLEYDRLYRASVKPARLRLFLFPVNVPVTFGAGETKSERQWFVDALNSVRISNAADDSSSPTTAAAVEITDFLFGLDKGQPVPSTKTQELAPSPTAKEIDAIEVRSRSDYDADDRCEVVADPIVLSAGIHHQMSESQGSQVAEQGKVYHHGDYFSTKITEAMARPTVQIAAGNYSTAIPPPTEPQVYYIPASAGAYGAPAMRPVAGQISQPYYGLQTLYGAIPTQSIRQHNVGAYCEAISMVRPSPFPATAVPAGVGVNEYGYPQVSYEGGAGRQVYYSTPRGAVPTYQTVMQAGEMRHGGVVLNQEGKIVSSSFPTLPFDAISPR